MAKKIRILAWCDSPACSTGFATVVRGIFGYLMKTDKYDIDIIGINDRGNWKDPKKYPYRIYPAATPLADKIDYYGRARLVSTMLGKDVDIRPPFDIVFTLNDPFILEQRLPVFNKGTLEVLNEVSDTFEKTDKLPANYHFKVVSYFPVDSPVKGNWVDASMCYSHYPVAYSQYGKEEIIKADTKLNRQTNIGDRLETIPHGYNNTDFYPIEDQEKKKEFRKMFYRGRVKDETFLVVAVARNQMRKDLPRTMAIFKEFQRRRPQSFLYLHCQEQDAWGSISQYAQQFNLEIGRDWGVPANFSANSGVSLETLNNIYNSADAILSTTLGEGWGFYNMEAFGTKRLVIAPNNTVHPEILGYDAKKSLDIDSLLEQKVRGLVYACKTTTSEWATYGEVDFERIRPLGNVDDAVKKLVWAFDNPDKVKEITDRAYEWIKDYTWEKVGAKWDELFTRVYDQLEADRKKAKKVVQEPVKL